jgi:hypothetical protein
MPSRHRPRTVAPGFDFLQGLVKNAGAALPGMGQWIAPTLDPQELEKRIEELRTVQFWLEQNARMLGATIQALEVQRMTLSTLQTMNVPMDDLRRSMARHAPSRWPTGPTPRRRPRARAAARPGALEPRRGQCRRPPCPAVDPMQWWGALTKQFTAARRRRDEGQRRGRGARWPAAMVKQSFEAAEQTLKKAASAPPRWPAAVVKAPRGGRRPRRAKRPAAARQARKRAPGEEARGREAGARADWRAAHARARPETRRAGAGTPPFPRRPRHASRLAHGAGAGGGADRCRQLRAPAPAGAADAGLGLLHRCLRAQAEALLAGAAAALAAAWPGSAASACRRGGQRRRVLRRAGAGADAAPLPAGRFEVFSGARRCSASSPSARWCMPTRTRPTWPS